jgi:hypothetical protein
MRPYMLVRQFYGVTIAVGLATILICATLTSYAGGADSCQKILGEWNWFIGGKVSFSRNAQAKWTPAAKGNRPALGTWSCDQRSGTYTVNWQNGFVDTLSLSADGAALTGTNSTGVKVWGKRNATSAGTSPAPSGTSRMPIPSTGQGGWTPMGPGGFGKQAPMPGPPQRMGPQGRPPPKGAG